VKSLSLKKTTLRLIAAILLLTSVGVASEKASGECYTVRGRLQYYNGGPSTRIWVVGTSRMLGVRDEEEGLAANVRAMLKDFDDVIFADFVVCPLTPRREGHMQMVRVESAKRIRHERIE
jgi:hypothetical protein